MPGSQQGIVIGGLIVFLFNKIGLVNWRYAMGIMLLPTFAYGYMFLNKEFPQTERVVSGFSYKDMLKACVSPLFIFMASCMILTAGTELGTNQWIAALLANVSHNPILLLVWISGIMALARQFGGTLIHNLKSTVVLLTSSILAFIGCILMGYTSGAVVFAQQEYSHWEWHFSGHLCWDLYLKIFLRAALWDLQLWVVSDFLEERLPNQFLGQYLTHRPLQHYLQAKRLMH
jgi:hypothetical protein